VQWVDEPKARGWFDVLRAFVGRAYPEGTEARRTETLALWRALSGVYLALDLPPTSDPVYRREVCNRLGCDGRVGSWRVRLGEVLAQHSPEYREARDDGTGFQFDLVPRAWLLPDGTVGGLGAAALPPTPQGSDHYRTGCARGESGAECWAWHEWVPGAFDAATYGYVNAAVPLRESWDLAQAVAANLVDAGFTAVIARSRAWCAVTNLRTARALGLEVPAELAGIASGDAAERLTADPAAAPVGLIASGVIGPLAVLVAGGLPLAGAVVGVLAGIPFLLQAIFGRAVGYSVDPWGRREPVYQPTAISGTGRDAPVHEVPAPPFRVDPVALGVGVYVPPSVEILDGGESDEGGTREELRASRGGAAKIAAGALLAWLLLRR